MYIYIIQWFEDGIGKAYPSYEAAKKVVFEEYMNDIPNRFWSWKPEDYEEMCEIISQDLKSLDEDGEIEEFATIRPIYYCNE